MEGRMVSLMLERIKSNSRLVSGNRRPNPSLKMEKLGVMEFVGLHIIIVVVVVMVHILHVGISDYTLSRRIRRIGATSGWQ